MSLNAPIRGDGESGEWQDWRTLPVRLEDLASEFGVSCERVRQIEVRAFEKVQIGVKSRVAAIEPPPVRDRMQIYGQPPALTDLRAARFSVASSPA